MGIYLNVTNMEAPGVPVIVKSYKATALFLRPHLQLQNCVVGSVVLLLPVQWPCETKTDCRTRISSDTIRERQKVRERKVHLFGLLLFWVR